METAVVGHTEWMVTFADVDAVPTAGGIAHTTNEWETPGGGGAVAAVQLAKLADSATFFTATGDDASAPGPIGVAADVDGRRRPRRHATRHPEPARAHLDRPRR